MRAIILTFLISCLVLGFVSIQAFAKELKKESNYCEINPCMSRDQLRRALREVNKFNEAEIQHTLRMLEKPDVIEYGSSLLPISGFLYASGFNAAYFLDGDEWLLNATFVTSSGDIVNIPNMYSVYFSNNGVRFEYAYQKILILIPASIDPQSLDQTMFEGDMQFHFATFWPWPVVPTGGRLYDKNKQEGVLLVDFSMGLGAGLSFFPSLIFHKEFQTRPIHMESYE